MKTKLDMNQLFNIIDQKVTNIHLYDYIMNTMERMLNQEEGCYIKDKNTLDVIMEDLKTGDTFEVAYETTTNKLTTTYIGNNNQLVEEKEVEFKDDIIRVKERQSSSYNYMEKDDLAKVTIKNVEKLYIDNALAHRYDYDSVIELKSGITRGSNTYMKRLIISDDQKAVQKESEIHEITGSKTEYKKVDYCMEPSFNTKEVEQQCKQYFMVPATEEEYLEMEKEHNQKLSSEGIKVYSLK